MLLLLHIVVAFVGIGLTSFAYFTPTRLLTRLSVVTATLTLGSGTYLVFMHPSHLVQACIMGLIFFAIVSTGIIGANRKLATANSKI